MKKKTADRLIWTWSGIMKPVLPNMAPTIGASIGAARKGVAFNVMSTLVDWEREDLFHWPFDRMVACLSPLTRHLTMRADYGLREYTVYLRREPLPYG
ncbi:MAG: hypothetical protein RLO08_01505 [Parvibaculaceae bacterium]